MKSSDHCTHTRILVLGAVLALLFGCATKSDTITGQWQSPRERTEPYGSVLLVAAAVRDDARRAFEATLANAIRSSESSTATTTYDAILTPRLSREALVELAGRVNADAVIVTRILDQSFVDGRTADQVVTHLGPAVSISHNESTNSTVVVSSNVWTEIVPGSFALDTENLLETSVYELGKDGQLVYRATMNAHFELSPDQRIEMAAAVFADKISRRLRRDGVIR